MKAKTGSFAILPSAKVLFNKNKVTLSQITSTGSPLPWNKGTVVVCRKPNNQIHYILGSSHSYAELGTKIKVHHDQNPNMDFGGEFEVINEVSYEKDESGAVKYTWKNDNMELGKGANEDFKACLAVFK